MEERETIAGEASEFEAEQTGSAAPVPLWKRRPIQGAAAVVIVAAVGLGTWLGSRGPGDITVKGSISVGPLGSVDSDGGNAPAADGDPCQAMDGYDDITQGATVTIGGSTGQTLAVGALGQGVETNVDDSAGTPLGDCVFPFAVKVPGGQSAYTVTVSHRGTQTVTPAEAQSGVALTLGE